MAYSDKEGVDLVEYVLSADRTLTLDSRNTVAGSVEIVWTNAAATDAVVKLQEGIAGATDISGKTATIGAAEGTALIKLDSIVTPVIKVVLTKNTETTAKVTVRHYFKGAR